MSDSNAAPANQPTGFWATVLQIVTGRMLWFLLVTVAIGFVLILSFAQFGGGCIRSDSPIEFRVGCENEVARVGATPITAEEVRATLLQDSQNREQLISGIKAALLADNVAVQALQGPQGDPGEDSAFVSTSVIPKGAVVAFDRSGQSSTFDDSSGACPEGWTFFEPGGGRIIVGAGIHSNTDENGIDLTDYTVFADDPDAATGGSETHPLTPDEMPSHTHRLSTSDLAGTKIHDGLAGSNAEFGIDSVFHKPAGTYDGAYGILPEVLESTGGQADGSTRPHNNMPPYIALYFCKTEAE